MKTYKEINEIINNAITSYWSKEGQGRSLMHKEFFKVTTTLSKEELAIYWKNNHCPNIAEESKIYMMRALKDQLDQQYDWKIMRGVK